MSPIEMRLNLSNVAFFFFYHELPVNSLRKDILTNKETNYKYFQNFNSSILIEIKISILLKGGGGMLSVTQ